MGQVLHKRATTTYEIRRKIQKEKGTIDSIAKKYGINWNTAKKWKSRHTVEDKQMGNGRANSVLTKAEDWLICEVRRLTWLPLDDLFLLLKPLIKKLSRSGLHRCLQFYGLSKKPKEFLKKKKEGKFKKYEIGFLHIDITEFWLDKKKWNLFVAIDRETKFTYAEIFENKTVKSSIEFLKNVYNFFPYKIHRILTDNGSQFTYRLLKKELRPNKFHPFDLLCKQNGTKHKLTKFAHPWTNGQVEKMNHIIKTATLKLFHYETIEEFSSHLAKFLNYYNFSKKLKSLKFNSPYDIIQKKYQEKPKLFKKNPLHYCVGLDIFNIYESSVGRNFKPLESLLAGIFRIPERKVEISEDEFLTLFFDGTEQKRERPTKRQRIHYSGKKKMHTVKYQVIVVKKKKKPGIRNQKRKLRIAAVSKAFSGKTHDKQMYEKTNTIRPPGTKGKGDLGYQGTDLEIPIKKPRGKNLS